MGPESKGQWQHDCLKLPFLDSKLGSVLISDIMGMMMTFVIKHFANITVSLNPDVHTEPQSDTIKQPMKSEKWRNAPCCAMQRRVICHSLTSHAAETRQGQHQHCLAEGEEEK